jgi:hypothetical protein
MSNIVPWNEQERMAAAIAKSGLFGMKSPDQVLALMAIAQAEGRHPGTVARDYHIIQGRPALRADAMLARFQAVGGSVQWLIYTDAEVKANFSHPQGGSLTLSWTLAQAKSIGLATKDNWKNYPRAMLRARVISEGIRTVYPGVLTGEYTPEEVMDMAPTQAIDVQALDVTEAVEVKQIEAPAEDGFPLFIPGEGGAVKVYKRYADLDAWLKDYHVMVNRILTSKKLTPAQVNEKLAEFEDANAEIKAQAGSESNDEL